MAWFDWGKPVVPVGEKTAIDQQEFGIIDLGRDVSADLRRFIDEAIRTHGKPFGTGGVLSPAFLPIAGAGSAMASSLFAGNVFLATANPAALMQIGAGVGSAVMGPAGVIAQAPFIAAGGAIIPVVAPILLFTAISAMVISARLEQLQRALQELTSLVGQLLAQELAEDCAILASAMERLQDISGEFDGCGRFTEENRIRLALAERELNVLHHKYTILSELEVHDRLAAELAVPRTKLLAMSSAADIQADRLRLRLALQDNPDEVNRRLPMLEVKIDRYEEALRFLSENNPVKQRQKDLQNDVDNMRFLMKKVFAKKKLKKKITEIEETAEKVKQIQEVLSSLDDPPSGNSTDQQHLLVYYREQNGKGDLKAYYTHDLKLEADTAA